MTPQSAPSDEGICALCETTPAAKDDVLCPPCRRMVYESSEVVTDPLERLIGKHRLNTFLLGLDKTVCGCGMEWDGGPGHHRHHLAEVICEHFGMAPPSPWMPAPEWDALHPEDADRG